MARIRTIKPEFPQSESMGRVSREARLCFILLWTLADDAGRLRGNSRMLASILYPYDDDAKKHIDRWLEELSNEKCIVCYEAQGDRYIQVVAWTVHQKIDKPSASKIPPFDDGSSTPREDSRGFAKALEVSSEDQGRDQGEDQGREGIDRPPTSLRAVGPPSVPVASESIAQDPPPTKDRPSKKCPELFFVTPGMRDWAEATTPGVSVEEETAKFRDHTFATACTDWPGRWRNWMRKAAEIGGKTTRIGRAPPSETAWQRSQRERIEKFAPGIAAKAPGIKLFPVTIDMEAPNGTALALG